MEFTYDIIRSNRKTLALQICSDGKILVRSPLRMPTREIEAFVQRKAAWIQKHMQACNHQKQPPITPQQLHQLKQMANQLLPAKVAHYAEVLGIHYGNITIRAQKTLWGSCSSKGNLNFNCLLMLAPEAVQDYIVVHELCHRKQMNHSKAFWCLVESVMPDYRTHRQWLKEQGSPLIRRLTQV